MNSFYKDSKIFVPSNISRRNQLKIIKKVRHDEQKTHHVALILAADNVYLSEAFFNINLYPTPKLHPLHGHQLEHGFEAVVPEGGDEAHVKRSGVILGDEFHRCGRGIQPPASIRRCAGSLPRKIAAFWKSPIRECRRASPSSAPSTCDEALSYYLLAN